MRHDVTFTAAILVASIATRTEAFSASSVRKHGRAFTCPFGSTTKFSRTRRLPMSVVEEGTTLDFIGTELRGAAMKLHTTMQAPGQGEVEVKEPVKPHVTTHMDYLHFLVDSQHVYQAFEDIVSSLDEAKQFKDTGLERTKPLETDIEFMVKEYGLERPPVGNAGKEYASFLRNLAEEGPVPEFMCHFYNHYFAHTAGGIMIGKKMSALLLNKKKLEFYKWDGEISAIKRKVKNDFELMAAAWSREEKDQCVAGTAKAFYYGGRLNSHLKGNR